MCFVEARRKVITNPNCLLSEFNQMFKKGVNWYNTEKLLQLHEVEQRKVSKYNEIHYKAQKFNIPPGFSGTKVEVIEFEDKIEIYHKENLIITHAYNVPITI